MSLASASIGNDRKSQKGRKFTPHGSIRQRRWCGAGLQDEVLTRGDLLDFDGVFWGWGVGEQFLAEGRQRNSNKIEHFNTDLCIWLLLCQLKVFACWLKINVHEKKKTATQ